MCRLLGGNLPRSVRSRKNVVVFFYFFNVGKILVAQTRDDQLLCWRWGMPGGGFFILEEDVVLLAEEAKSPGHLQLICSLLRAGAGITTTGTILHWLVVLQGWR